MVRRSLLLRLLVLSLVVASLAVAATALLATYGTGSHLRDEVESNTSLLETDSDIRSALLDYASENQSWDGAEALVRQLADETGRRIALETPEGRSIVDSARLLDEGSGGLPSTPAARIDATTPRNPAALVELPTGMVSGPVVGHNEWQQTGSYYGWQLTDEERQQRQALADEAATCLQREDIDATIEVGDGGTRVLITTPPDALDTADASRGRWTTSTDPSSLLAHPCVPDELQAPSAAARQLNQEILDRTSTCLDQNELDYEVAADEYGMREVQPPGQAVRTDAWQQCEETAQVEAMRPYVAPPADLYLGSSDRFDPFSPDARRRTAVTVGAVLLAAAAVTVLAGRRLVRPIRALTDAAQKMEGGDHTARVPVQGKDEVTRLAAAFNAMAESIETSDRQRKNLVGDVAHELRSPLANVRSHLEAADYGVVPLDESLVQSLQEESALLERLVADLQDLALADGGMLRIHPEECDAADLANQVVAAHRAQADASGVAVEVDAPGPVAVLADPARLRQALGNLVANAVTHTPAGGSVAVAVGHDDGWVVLTVSDTGPGIAADHLPHVFDRFYRADPSRSRTTGGSGLGLAITKHLVEAHDGRVEVSSTVDRGSVFTIRLPEVAPDAGSGAEPVETESGGRGGHRYARQA